MGYSDREKRREYGRKWIAARRNEWYSNNGPCRRCWSTENLLAHFPDSDAKSEHRVWTWRKERRDAELKKCVILCRDCWYAVRKYKHTSARRHGTVLMYDKGGCRCQDCRDAHALQRRIYRGKDMALSTAMKELESIRDKTYCEIDALSKQIEERRSKVADIDTAIRVLSSLNITAVTAGLPECDDQDSEIPGETVEVDEPADGQENVVESNPPAEQQYQGKRNRKSVSIVLARERKSAVTLDPLAGQSSVLSAEFYCNKCRAKFMNQSALDLHNSERHSAVGDPSKCPVSNCRAKFASESELEMHVITAHPKFASEYGYS